MNIPLFPCAESRTTRRSFLAATSSLAAAAAWSSRAYGAVKRYPRLAEYPFSLGVASGDPAPDGFVIWTRLALRPLEGGGMPNEPVEVSWQVCDDERMTRVIRSGATVATPEWAHAVHVEVEGLQPDRWYWYQFKVGSEASPSGRARTMPATDAAPARLNFVFASCQHFEQGYYTAYEHMAREELDLVVHLGDYIYEGGGKEGGVRKHVGGKLDSLADYRNRHAQYKTDPALQAIHAAVPWLVSWDDHELENNYADEISENSEVPVEAFRQQRARAYQAYYEHMPLRRSSLPNGPDMQLYRRIAFGRLAEFYVLDTRQYRTDQPCGDGNKSPCDAVYAENATLLGESQRNWLCEGLSASPVGWKVLAQQVMMARVDKDLGEGIKYSMDQWPGYEAERRRLLRFLHERNIANAVVLTGDIHSNWANELIADFDDLESRTVAAEFVGTSISSGRDGAKEPAGLAQLLAENPFVKFHNAERGYVRCQLTPSAWRSDYQVVTAVTQPQAELITRASFVLESGDPTLKSA